MGVLGAGALGWGLWPRAPRSRQDAPAGRVVIDYWEKWTGPEGHALQRVVDEFNHNHQRIWVRRTPVSEIMSKAMVAISGGDPPDVIGVFSFSVPQFAESGAVYPLDELAASGRSVSAEAYAPAVLKLLSHDGHQWAGVSSVYNLALYYNRPAFRDAGLDPDRPPRTVSELDEMTAKLTLRDGERITRAGFLANLPPWWPYFWPIMFGGRLYDQASNRAELTDPATIAAYQWVQDSAKRVGPKAGTEFASAFSRSMHSPEDPFISGKAAMIVMGPWIANFIRLYNPGLDYGVAPVPVADSIYDPTTPTGLLEADVLMIPRGCKHPAEAFEFLAWMQTQHVLETLALSHGKGSPLRVTSEMFRSAHPNRGVAVHDAVTASPRVQVLPQTRVWQAYADMTNGMFDQVWRGADVKSSLAAVQARAQAMMDHAAELRGLRQRGGGPAA